MIALSSCIVTSKDMHISALIHRLSNDRYSASNYWSISNYKIHYLIPAGMRIPIFFAISSLDTWNVWKVYLDSDSEFSN